MMKLENISRKIKEKENQLTELKVFLKRISPGNKASLDYAEKIKSLSEEIDSLKKFTY